MADSFAVQTRKMSILAQSKTQALSWAPLTSPLLLDLHNTCSMEVLVVFCIGSDDIEVHVMSFERCSDRFDTTEYINVNAMSTILFEYSLCPVTSSAQAKNASCKASSQPRNSLHLSIFPNHHSHSQKQFRPSTRMLISLSGVKPNRSHQSPVPCIEPRAMEIESQFGQLERCLLSPCVSTAPTSNLSLGVARPRSHDWVHLVRIATAQGACCVRKMSTRSW